MASPALAPIEQTTGGIRFSTVGERLVRAITGCRGHNWGWPQTTVEMGEAYRANKPYDSHQQCPKCGATRLYNQKTMACGPLFTKEPKKRG